MRIIEWPVLIGAISIAFIASAETLLCATAVDQMHSGPRTKYDRELTAQGVGNTICGAARRAADDRRHRALGRQRRSRRRDARLGHHARRLAAVVRRALLPFTLKYIPLSALAAVLVFTGYKLAYPKIVPTLLKYRHAARC